MQSCPSLSQQTPSDFCELGHSLGVLALFLPPAEGVEESRDAMNGKSLGKDLMAGEEEEEQWQRAQARCHRAICGA